MYPVSECLPPLPRSSHRWGTAQEPDLEPKRSLFNGLAQVIVQAGKTSGEIVVEAYAEEWPGPKLPSVSLRVKTKKAELRAAV